MKHFAHRRGDFSGWSETQRRNFLQKLMPIMDRYVRFYVGAAIHLDEFKQLSQEKRQDLQDPYFACFQVSVHAIGIFAEQNFPVDQVDVFFDHRPKSVGMGNALFERCVQDLDVGGRLNVLAFASPKKIMPLQAADLLAYELNQHRQGSGKMADSRWPFQEIIRQIKDSQGRKEFFFDFFNNETRSLNEFLP